MVRKSRVRLEWIVPAIFVILVGVSFASDKPRADASALEIERLERAWAECFVTGVPGAARDFIADDFVGVSSKGVPYGKAQGLQDILDSKGQFRSFVVSGVKVRLYGNAAVAQGSDAWEGTDGSKGSSLWTDTWIRTGDRWQIVAGQDTQPKSQP